MHQRLRPVGSKDNYPGPGSYYRFSEFGILCPKKNKKKGKDNKENTKNEETQGKEENRNEQQENNSPGKEAENAS